MKGDKHTFVCNGKEVEVVIIFHTMVSDTLQAPYLVYIKQVVGYTPNYSEIPGVNFVVRGKIEESKVVCSLLRPDLTTTIPSKLCIKEFGASVRLPAKYIVKILLAEGTPQRLELDE